jgi:hypothetical protein
MVPLYPRIDSFNVLANTDINQEKALNLSIAANECWEAILHKDSAATGEAIKKDLKHKLPCFQIWSIRIFLNRFKCLKMIYLAGN